MAETVVQSIKLVVKIGATFSAQISWKDETDTLVPLPGGTTVEVKVRPTLTSTNTLLRFTSVTPSASEGLITINTPGVIVLSLTAAQTAALTPIANAVFDIKYVLASGTFAKLTDGRGKFAIEYLVTRP